MFDWLFSLWDALLAMLGLRGKSGTILFLGLDNAGKTTLLHLLRDGTLVQPAPTQRPTQEEFAAAGVNFRAFDLGGHEEARETWKDYFLDISGIVFMVDLYDANRYDEAQAVLYGIERDLALEDVPIVVFGNKADINPQVSAEHLAKILEANPLPDPTLGFQGQPVKVFVGSVRQKRGHVEAIQWLASKMK